MSKKNRIFSFLFCLFLLTTPSRSHLISDFSSPFITLFMSHLFSPVVFIAVTNKQKKSLIKKPELRRSTQYEETLGKMIFDNQEPGYLGNELLHNNLFLFLEKKDLDVIKKSCKYLKTVVKDYWINLLKTKKKTREKILKAALEDGSLADFVQLLPVNKKVTIATGLNNLDKNIFIETTKKLEKLKDKGVIDYTGFISGPFGHYTVPLSGAQEFPDISFKSCVKTTTKPK